MATVIAGMYAKRIVEKKFLRLLIPLSQCLKDARRFKYYILLPEVPPDTPETNALLQNTLLPDFQKLTRENYVNAVGKSALDYELGISQLEESLENGSVEKSFSAVFERIECLTSPLEFSWSTLLTLNAVDTSLNLGSAVSKLSPTVNRVRSGRFTSLPIYHAVKEVNADRESLSLDQQQVVNKHLLQGQLSGTTLSKDEKAKFDNQSKKLHESRNKFSKNVEKQTNMFKLTVANKDQAQEFSEELRLLSAMDKSRPHEGPWIITLQHPIYNMFIEHCSDRMQRLNAWRAYVSRCSLANSDTTNSICIEEIRLYRQNMAKLLGFPSYAEMSMQNKMAGCLSNAQGVLKTIHLKSKPVVEKELLKLQEFALQNNFKDQLELWDVPYWRQLYRNEVYKVDEAEVCKYFELSLVLSSIFSFCQKLFGITIRESQRPVNFWNEDVRYFEVLDEKDQLLGNFCLDPYSRPGLKTRNSLFVSARSRNQTVGHKPLSYLIVSFPRPLTKGTPTHLKFEEVVALFEQFGAVLQHTLSASTYTDLSSLSRIEADVLQTASHFFSQWLFHYPVFSSLFKHSTTGEPMPSQLHQTLVKRARHMAVYDLSTQVYLSILDLELHSKKGFWLDMMRTLWAEHIPFKLSKEDVHPCSFQEIFSDNQASAYYSHTWAKMVAADFFSAFLEAGLDNEQEMQVIGRRFRDTFLDRSGSCSTTEAFRKFRGRDVSIEALLALYGMKQDHHHTSHREEELAPLLH